MKPILLLPLAALAACAAEPPAQATADAETQLQAELAGRLAGEPVTCVRQRDLEGNRTVGGRILFETKSRNLVYVNESQCPDLGFGRALKTRSTNGQLCAGDIADVFDPSTGLSYGGCGLGRFTPYRRTR